MITTRSDQRLITMDIDGTDADPVTAGDARFIPGHGRVTLDLAGCLDSVEVRGQLLTKSGKPYGNQRSCWYWSAFMSAESWPPAGAPEIALDLVVHVQAAEASR